MNDQPNRKFALTIHLDELLNPDAVEPVERECGDALCECGHAAETHDPCCVSACGCDGFEPRKPSIEEVFKAVMREIKDLAQDALGYEQICDPVQAVRRLALELAQAKEWENMYVDQRERREKAEAELAEAKRLWEVADAERVASRNSAKLLRLNLSVSEERQTAMRAALEQVEWVYEDGGECAWCRNRIVYGHKPDCARQLALRQGEGGRE